MTTLPLCDPKLQVICLDVLECDRLKLAGAAVVRPFCCITSLVLIEQFRISDGIIEQAVPHPTNLNTHQYH